MVKIFLLADQAQPDLWAGPRQSPRSYRRLESSLNSWPAALRRGNGDMSIEGLLTVGVQQGNSEGRERSGHSGKLT